MKQPLPPSRRGFAIGAAATLAATYAAAQEDSAPRRSLLFIGNSLTYTNNLPAFVQAVFAAEGEAIDVEMVARPGVSLNDHWNARQARRVIMRGGWSTVILQQGPSALPSSRSSLRQSVARYARVIAEVGARPALYSVWPDQSRRRDFPDAIESYTLAAADVGALLFPVAAAWLEAPSSIALYDEDGLHPTPYGTYLASLVIYGVLAERSPIGLSTELMFTGGHRAIVPADEALALQQAAAAAIAGLTQPT